MNDPQFVVERGVAIPPRTIPNAGPRESKYPVDNLKEGEAFAVSVKDEKEARQKQSQFSGLAKTRGIKLVTRYFQSDSPFANVQAPCLGVWHAGTRTAKAAPTQAEQAVQASAPAEDDVIEL